MFMKKENNLEKKGFTNDSFSSYHNNNRSGIFYESPYLAKKDPSVSLHPKKKRESNLSAFKYKMRDLYGQEKAEEHLSGTATILNNRSSSKGFLTNMKKKPFYEENIKSELNYSVYGKKCSQISDTRNLYSEKYGYGFSQNSPYKSLKDSITNQPKKHIEIGKRMRSSDLFHIVSKNAETGKSNTNKYNINSSIPNKAKLSNKSQVYQMYVDLSDISGDEGTCSNCRKQITSLERYSKLNSDNRKKSLDSSQNNRSFRKFSGNKAPKESKIPVTKLLKHNKSFTGFYNPYNANTSLPTEKNNASYLEETQNSRFTTNITIHKKSNNSLKKDIPKPDPVKKNSLQSESTVASCSIDLSANIKKNLLNNNFKPPKTLISSNITPKPPKDNHKSPAFSYKKLSNSQNKGSRQNSSNKVKSQNYDEEIIITNLSPIKKLKSAGSKKAFKQTDHSFVTKLKIDSFNV